MLASTRRLTLARLLAPTLLPRQRHPLGRAPEIFQRVERPRLFVEQVDHHVAVVEQDPAALVVAFDAQPLVAQLVFERVVDLVADGVELPAAVAGGDARSSRTPA